VATLTVTTSACQQCRSTAIRKRQWMLMQHVEMVFGILGRRLCLTQALLDSTSAQQNKAATMGAKWC